MTTPVLTTDAAADVPDADMGQLFRTLWAGKLWIILFTFLFGALGYINGKSTPPTYRADALLQLEDNSAQMSLPTSIRDLTSGNPRSVTEIEILYSRLVLGQRGRIPIWTGSRCRAACR